MAVEAVRADANNNDDDETTAVAVPLGDDVVHVLPFKDWPSSAIRALREGDFDTWAEKCLASSEDHDDYETWAERDPTVAEVDEFFAAWEEATGENVGKSRASRRSSKPKRKR